VDPYVITGEDQQTSGSGASPSSLPAHTGGGSHNHLQSSKKKNTSSRFHFCFPFFLDLPLSPFFFWGSMPQLLIAVWMVEDGIRSCRGW